MVAIHGSVAPGFGPVRRAFAQNFSERGEVGAGVCVYRRGEPVVDLWAGVADPASGRSWDEDTLALTFSTTKGVTATCVHVLVERGVLDWDAPVASIWPEFAANGKGAIPLRWLLCHRAGLPVLEGDFTREQVYAWEPVCTALAAQAPVWEPGTQHGYHVRTYGWLLGEVVRRAAGCTLGEFLAREIARPLDLEFYVGLPEACEPRVAVVIPPPEPTDPGVRAIRERFLGPDTLLGRALSGPSGLFAYGPVWNTPELHAAEIPSSNGIGTARAVARLYAAHVGEVNGVRLLAPSTLERVCEPQADGPDAVIHLPTRFGLGFMLPPVLSPSCPGGCFGHPGAGGSLGFADPDAGIGFGYVMNRMDLGLTGDARTVSLVTAVYQALRDGA